MAGVQAAKAKLWDTQPLSWGDAYGQALAHYQGAKSDYEAANPGTALAANLVGSAAPAILAAPLAGAGVVGNALTGAAIGGVSGAANAQPGDVLNAGLGRRWPRRGAWAALPYQLGRHSGPRPAMGLSASATPCSLAM